MYVNMDLCSHRRIYIYMCVDVTENGKLAFQTHQVRTTKVLRDDQTSLLCHWTCLVCVRCMGECNTVEENDRQRLDHLFFSFFLSSPHCPSRPLSIAYLFLFCGRSLSRSWSAPSWESLATRPGVNYEKRWWEYNLRHLARYLIFRATHFSSQLNYWTFEIFAARFFLS